MRNRNHTVAYEHGLTCRGRCEAGALLAKRTTPDASATVVRAEAGDEAVTYAAPAGAGRWESLRSTVSWTRTASLSSHELPSPGYLAG